jgi:hypothetical protein
MREEVCFYWGTGKGVFPHTVMPTTQKGRTWVPQKSQSGKSSCGTELQLPFRFARNSPEGPNLASAFVSSARGFANGNWFAPEKLAVEVIALAVPVTGLLSSD